MPEIFKPNFSQLEVLNCFNCSTSSIVVIIQSKCLLELMETFGCSTINGHQANFRAGLRLHSRHVWRCGALRGRDSPVQLSWQGPLCDVESCCLLSSRGSQMWLAVTALRRLWRPKSWASLDFGLGRFWVSAEAKDAAAGMSAPIYFQSDLKINGSRHFDRRQNWCELNFTNTAVRLGSQSVCSIQFELNNEFFFLVKIHIYHIIMLKFSVKLFFDNV